MMKSLKSLAILLLLGASTVIYAEQTPTVHQVDGYFLQPVGNLKVTALFDGELGLPRSDLLGISAEKANRLFEKTCSCRRA